MFYLKTFEEQDKKQAYLSYFESEEEEQKVIKIIDKIDELRSLHRVKKIINKDKEIEQAINNADIVVFFLTNLFMKSKRYQIESHMAKCSNKPIVNVLLENIDMKTNNNPFTSVELIDAKENKESIDHIRAILFNTLRIEKRYFNKNSDLSSHFLFISRQKVLNYWSFKLDNVNIISNQEALIKDENKIMIVNLNNEKCNAEIKIDSTFFCNYCWIEHSATIFVMNEMYSLSSLYKKTGELIENISLDFNYSYVYSMFYNQITRDLYIHYKDGVEDEELKGVCVLDSNDFKVKLDFIEIALNDFLKFSNHYIYGWDETELVIYDLNLNILTSIELKVRIRNVFSDSIVFTSFIDTDVDTIILNNRNFSILGSFKHPFITRMIYKNKLVLSDNQNLFIYRNNLIKNDDSKSKLFCSSNRYRGAHILRNPCMLPCGNSACLNCIYDNFNIYKNTFECNFESCQKEHRLEAKLNPNIKLENAIMKNCDKILKSFIAKAKKMEEGILISL